MAQVYRILPASFFWLREAVSISCNVIIKPEDSICMIELDEKGENYRIVWGLVNGGRPTSELPSHLMNLEVKKLQIQITVWSIMHIPPILLHSHLYFHSKIKCLRENCGRWQRSVRLFFRTVSVLFRGWFREEGEIAVATSELMKKYDLAIWAHHGMFAAGEGF